jgi:voltage-gated potassium channel
LGTITATIASWLVERVAEREEAAEAATQAQVQELSDQIRHLQAMLTYLVPDQHQRTVGIRDREEP